MNKKELIYADLNKYDNEYRIILSTLGTKRDLETHKIVLRDGLELVFYTDDVDADGNADNLIFKGVNEFDQLNKRWVTKINWEEIKHLSELTTSNIEPFDPPKN